MREYSGDRYGYSWDKFYDVMAIVWTGFMKIQCDGHEVVVLVWKRW